MNRRILIGLAALTTCALLLTGCSSGSPDLGVPRTVNVSATGSAEVAPDAAKASVTVAAVNSTSASAAQSAAAASTAAVILALKKAGVEQSDIATAAVSVTPTYRYSSTGSQTLSGYQATQTLTVTLRDLATAGATLDSVTAAGGNAVTIDSVSTYVTDPAAATQKARAQAVDIARAEAQQYADLLGFELGPVTSVAESSSNSPAPVPMAAAATDEKVSTPIEPGTTKVSVTLDVSWLIQD